MRPICFVPVLLLLAACGATKFSRDEASKDLKVDYPVLVTTHVPASASEIKGSEAHAKLVATQELVTAKNWFVVERTSEGADRERFTFKPGAHPPQNVQTVSDGFDIPVAHGAFAGAFKQEPDAARTHIKVLYKVRLESPMETFSLFQIEHPKAKPGETANREALYKREGKVWILQNTNERYKKLQ